MKTMVSNFQITAQSAEVKGGNGYIVEVKGFDNKVNISQKFQDPLKAMKYMFLLSKRLKLSINRLDLAAVSIDYQRAKQKALEAQQEQTDIVSDAQKAIADTPAEDAPETLKLEMEAAPTPILQQFKDMKAKHPDALLLFRCGDFYETYEDDAETAAKVLGITLTKNSKSTRMAGFPYHALDTYLPRLIRHGVRVAICDQLENNTKKGAK